MNNVHQSNRKPPKKGFIETLADGEGFAWLYSTIGKKLDSISRLVTRVLATPFLFIAPVKKNKIVFRSGLNFYGGELRPIVQELTKFREPYEIVWLINPGTVDKDVKSFAHDIRLTDALSLRALYDLSTARVIVDTEPRRQRMLKKKSQFYIQTSRNSTPIQFRLRNFTANQLRANKSKPDICIIGNDFENSEYRSVYGNNPVYLQTGHPRNKALLRLSGSPQSNTNDRLALAKKFGFVGKLQKNNLCLFVASRLREYPDFACISQALKRRFGGNWIILVVSSLPKFAFRDNVYDVRSYLNRHKMMVAADVLVTDGTGWTLDYLLSKRPVFLFNTDEDTATAEEFGRDRFQGLGLEPAYSPEALAENILAYNSKVFQETLRKFLNKNSFSCNELSARRIAELMRLLCRPGISMTEIYKRALGTEALSARRKLHPGIIKGFFIGFAEGWLCSWLYRTVGKSLDKFLHRHLTSAISSIHWKLPIQRDKIIFWMCHQKYGGNTKYVTEEILRQNLPYDLVWVVRYSANPGLRDFPEKVRVINYGSLRAQKEIATAKVWVDDTIRTALTQKRNGQHYIQTWHGSLGLKRFEQAWGGEMIEVTNRITDVCISNSSFETNEVYREKFWKQTKILEFGHPRNDIFFWEPDRIKSIKDKVYAHFGIPENKRIVLYAPTFREIHFNQKKYTQEMLECYDVPVTPLLKNLEKTFQGEWIFVERFHNNVKKALRMFPRDTHAIDAAEYADIQELMVSADILISDYSSCMFDFMLSRKPVFIYATDLEQYETKDRGFYYPIDSTPFPIARTEAELLENISSFDLDSYKKDVERFLQERGCIDDGQASARVVEYIKGLLDNEKGRK